MNRRKAFVLSAVLICGLLVAGAAWASTAGYDLAWWTVDGGGQTFSSGGGYTLGSTAGQPDPGLLTGGGYTVGGGFWGGGAAAVTHGIYLPLVLQGF
jgi:hypothetical protein